MIRMSARLDLRGLDKLNATVGVKTADAVMSAAEYIVADVNAHWSPEIPSFYGEAPAVRTGRLKNSARVQWRGGGGRFSSSADAFEAELRYMAPYSGVLETGYLNRPFLKPAVERTANVIGPMFFVRLFT